MPSDLDNDSQNSPENLASMSDIISVGNPWSFHISQRNVLATSLAVAFSRSPIKCAIFVNRSTSTIIWVYPCDSGRCVMMSVERDVHATKEVCSGCSIPYCACLGDLLCCHSSQDLM